MDVIWIVYAELMKAWEEKKAQDRQSNAHAGQRSPNRSVSQSFIFKAAKSIIAQLETEYRKNQRDGAKKDFRDKWAQRAVIVGTGVLVAHGVLFALTWQETKEEQKPLVYTETVLNRPFTFGADGARTFVKVTYRNVGKTFAKRVYAVVAGFPMDTDMEFAKRVTCETAKAISNKFGVVLFPDQSISTIERVIIKNDTVRNHIERAADGREIFHPMIATCVAYRIPGQKKVHTAAFGYILLTANSEDGEGLPMNRHTIPLDQLILRVSEFFPSGAN